MRRMISLLGFSLALMCSGVAGVAAEPWTKADIALEALCLTAIVADWSQTRQFPDQYGKKRYVPRFYSEDPAAGTTMTIPAHWETYYSKETNSLLGEHPPKLKIDVYFLLSLGAHTWISNMLPQPWRRLWQLAVLAVQTDNIGHNLRLGFKVKF